MLASWLAGSATLDDFLSGHFQKQPFVRPATAAPAVPLLTWATMAALLDARPDMLVVRNGRLRLEPDPSDFTEARALFAEGHSLVVRGCERWDVGLRGLAEAVADEIDGDVSIQAYATPGGFHSFGWHYDCEDVFIVQTTGVKDYLLRRNTVNPEPTIDAMPRDMQFERETSPRIACTLIPGDWLYIPRGYWHVARATEDALSISVGVLSPAARGRTAPGSRGVKRASSP